MILLVILLVAAVLLAPSEALAWGPGVHLAIGHRVLESLDMVCPQVAEALTVHSRSFLYGCLSADIFIGKGSSFRPGHSHNWETGLEIIRGAHRDDLTANAYGYLSHLAADTIAHNFYVPNLLGLAPMPGRLGHVYLEMQADQLVGFDAAEALALVPLRLTAADRNLLTATKARPLPFRVKKRIFRSGLLMAGQKSLRDSLGFVGRQLPWSSNEDFLALMLDLSWRMVMSLLDDPMSSPALGLDPIGSQNLAKAGRFRRRQATLMRHKGFCPIFPVNDRLLQLPSPDGRPFLDTIKSLK